MTTGDKEASLTAVVRDWSSAGDWCQERCMDLVSIETEQEWNMVRNKMEAAGAKFIWTSGHKCDRDVGQRSDVTYFHNNINIFKYFCLQMLH